MSGVKSHENTINILTFVMGLHVSLYLLLWEYSKSGRTRESGLGMNNLGSLHIQMFQNFSNIPPFPPNFKGRIDWEIIQKQLENLPGNFKN